MSTTDPTAETLPNPYRFTVKVDRLGIQVLGTTWWYVNLIGGRDGEWFLTTDEFPTKEEADTHAALILSALHQAVME